MKSAILNLRPISLSTCTGYLPFYGSNCGLKGAAILHNWLPCAIQACGTQALAVPFCISVCDMEKLKKEIKNAFKLIAIVVIGIPIFLAGLYGFASVMSHIFKDSGEPLKQTQTIDTQRQVFARKLADQLVETKNTNLLRLWASSHNISVANFSSPETLREEIRRKSKDFSLYNNEGVFNALFMAITATDSGLKAWNKVTQNLEK